MKITEPLMEKIQQLQATLNKELSASSSFGPS
jgi:hypothetical protein